jgi:hypothetical protein
MEKRAKNNALKRFEHLVDYFKNSPLVDNGQTRRILISEFYKVYRIWKEKKWEELTNL